MRVWLVWKSFLLFGSQEWKQGGWVTTGIMSTFQFMSHQMYPVGRVGYDRDRISRGCCSCSCSLAWHASQGPQPRPTAPSTWTVLTGRGRGGLRNIGGGRGVHGAVACKRRWRNQQHWRCSGDGPLTLSPSDLDVLTAASAYNLATWTCLDSQRRPPYRLSISIVLSSTRMWLPACLSRLHPTSHWAQRPRARRSIEPLGSCNYGKLFYFILIRDFSWFGSPTNGHATLA